VDAELRQGPLLRLFSIAQAESRLMQLAMAASPLTPEDFAVYSWLRLRGPVTPTALAADLGMHQPTLSNYLRRMTGRGHLRRRPNPLDGRSQLVSLTAAGTRVTERSFPGFTAAITAFRDNLALPDAEVDRVLLALSATLELAVAQVEAARDADGLTG
jgi:DNA-binding MarR family transcriptional regulator